MEIFKNFSLKRYNSFAIDAKAKYFVNINSTDDLLQLIGTKEFTSEKRFVLGGGSNVLFRTDFDGIVINIELKGINLVEINADYATVKVKSGESWNEFAETCSKNKYYGIENLVSIPGKVGAAPVQNIGAYGVEQKDYFARLTGFNIESGEFIELENYDCKFAYRDSIFKHELRDKVIITDVSYKLSRQWELNDSYKELKTELGKFSFVEQDCNYVLNTVKRLREQKLPDPKKLGNAGSFFKNPIIDIEHFENIAQASEAIPHYQVGGCMLKIPAAWLIEKCGWKGYREGDSGVYSQHALILVNYGNATGEDIYSLSEKIIGSVQEKFGIKLEREVIVL